MYVWYGLWEILFLSKTERWCYIAMCTMNVSKHRPSMYITTQLFTISKAYLLVAPCSRHWFIPRCHGIFVNVKNIGIDFLAIGLVFMCTKLLTLRMHCKSSIIVIHVHVHTCIKQVPSFICYNYQVSQLKSKVWNCRFDLLNPKFGHIPC